MQMKKYVYLFLALIVTLLLASGCMQLVLGTALNQVHLTKIAVQDDRMYLMGEFNAKSYQQVKEAVEANPQVRTVVLTANSGSIDDETTFKLGRYIRSMGLNTHLVDQSVIASGAVDLFLSGVHRTIEEGAQLGVHSWSDGRKQAADYPRDHPDHRLNADYIRDMLGSEDFYWFTIYAAPADSIYWMTDSEIERFKIATEALQAPSHDDTPFGETFTAKRTEILEN
jgi:beta-lactamase class D